MSHSPMKGPGWPVQANFMQDGDTSKMSINESHPEDEGKKPGFFSMETPLKKRNIVQVDDVDKDDGENNATKRVSFISHVNAAPKTSI